jgi:hypothetical protein
MIDEDEELFAQFEHAQNTVNRNEDMIDQDDDDLSWLNNDDWQHAMQGAEQDVRRGTSITEDTVMGDF